MDKHYLEQKLDYMARIEAQNKCTKITADLKEQVSLLVYGYKGNDEVNEVVKIIDNYLKSNEAKIKSRIVQEKTDELIRQIGALGYLFIK